MEHFLALTDLTPDELRGLLQQAIELKDEWKAGGNQPVLQGKTKRKMKEKKEKN